MPNTKTTITRLALAAAASAAVALSACGSDDDTSTTAKRASTEQPAQSGTASATSTTTATAPIRPPATGTDEEQVRAVGEQAAAAVASRDAVRLCAVTDLSRITAEIRGSDNAPMKRLLRKEGVEGVCIFLAEKGLFAEQSAQERADAEAFEIVSVDVQGDDATAEVRARDVRTDATFKRVDGEWTYVGSTALE